MPAVFPFLTMFSTVAKTSFKFSVTFILSSVNAFGKELMILYNSSTMRASPQNLTHYQTTKLQTSPNWKHLQTAKFL